MTRGELYRSAHAAPERGDKPGYYVVVGRVFVAENDRISTVVCAPVYSEVLGIPTEVVLERSDGVRHRSAVRCDFLMLMFKHNLTRFVGRLAETRRGELDRALAIALDLPLG